jgi:uncharacterized protein YbjT (DUF2867 family)
MTPSRLLILGGTGFVGQALCETLTRHGLLPRWQVRIPTRRRSHAQVVGSLPGVEVVQASVHDPVALRQLVRGCDKVVNLVAILQGSAADFQRVHVDLPRQLAAICREEGVEQLIHISALGVSLDAPSMYLRSKGAGEAALRQGFPETTLLRPSVIFGAGDRFMNLFAQMQTLAPLVPLAGASAQMQPVWVTDVAEAIVACLRAPHQTSGQVFECAGPRVYTLGELVRLAGIAVGQPRPILPLPSAIAWCQAVAMECLPGEPLLSRDNLASLRVPNVATGQHRGLTDLGIQPSALEAVLPQYLGARHGLQRFDGWRGGRR